MDVTDKYIQEAVYCALEKLSKIMFSKLFNAQINMLDCYPSGNKGVLVSFSGKPEFMLVVRRVY
jgi:hypothetical protein